MDANDLLPDYALGLLDADEAARVEALLEASAEARSELRRLQAHLQALGAAVAEAPSTVEAMMAELAPAPPPPAVWRRLKRRLRPPPPRRALLAWAAALLVGAVGLGWGLVSQQRFQGATTEQRRLGNEQALVREFLARPEVRITPLRDEGEAVGSALLLPAGFGVRVLFVMRDPPPPGANYQLWGHKEELRLSLLVSSRAVFEAQWEGLPAVSVSLEPAGGSDRPTRTLATLALR